MKGKITKGVGGFYTVLTDDKNLITCSVKGIFRNKNITPTVGDDVIVQFKDNGYVISQISERKNMLIRPNVANVSQVMIVMACLKPEPNFLILDKLTAICEDKNLKVIICFNKTDLADAAKINEIKRIYEKTPYNIHFINAKNKAIGSIEDALYNNTTVLAGPSGVGKSTLLNCICPDFYLNTGEISEKIGRGKHTTRHTELLTLNESAYIADTPGFTNIDMSEIDIENLKYCFAEFSKFEGMCKYASCMHDHEPDCRIKEAVKNDEISKSRYESYINIKNEISSNPRSYKK